MSGEFVSVDRRTLSFAWWAADKVRGDVATWGMLQSTHRTAIAEALIALFRALEPLVSLHNAHIDMRPAKVRELLRLVDVVSSRVHSARKVMTEDRRRALGLLARVKRGLQSYLQLSLFPG